MSAQQTTHPAAVRTWQQLLPMRLLDLTSDPVDNFPALLTRKGALRLLAFPAASGVFAMYTVAKGFALGDRVGFAAVTLGVLLLGSLAGVAALFLVGEVSGRQIARYERRGGERAWMFIVFSYSTWPFLPLLLLVGGVDLLLQGSLVFSAARPPLPTDFVWAIRVLIMATLVIWGVLMVGGTAVVLREPEPRAARDVVRWIAPLGGIVLLAAVLVAASLRVW